jgi:hypothetical protein
LVLFQPLASLVGIQHHDFLLEGLGQLLQLLFGLIQGGLAIRQLALQLFHGPLPVVYRLDGPLQIHVPQTHRRRAIIALRKSLTGHEKANYQPQHPSCRSHIDLVLTASSQEVPNRELEHRRFFVVAWRQGKAPFEAQRTNGRHPTKTEAGRRAQHIVHRHVAILEDVGHQCE